MVDTLGGKVADGLVVQVADKLADDELADGTVVALSMFALL